MARPWWRRAAPDEECEEPGSHLARAMAYETLVVAFTAIALAVLVFVVSRGQFEDLYVKTGGVTPSDEVVLLSIGEEALYLWDPAAPEPEVTPRPLLAQLVRFADAAGAEVIVLDVLLDRPATDDVALLDAARAARAPVVGATRFVQTDPVSGAEFAAGLAQVYGPLIQPGFANLQVEEPWLLSEDRLVRRAPLQRRVSTARLTGSWPMNIIGAEQSDEVQLESLALVAARAAGADPVLDEDPLLIAFSGPERSGAIPTVRASAALRALGAAALAEAMGVEMPVDVPPDIAAVMDGKVVVIGRVDEAADDRFVTPYAWPLLVGEDMAGARVQATLIDQLITGRRIRSVAGVWAWIPALLLAAAVFFTRRWVRDDVHAIGWVLACGAGTAAGILLFRASDVAFDVGPGIGGILLTLCAVHVWEWAIDESRRT